MAWRAHLQLIGPALGFILTVSSLVVAFRTDAGDSVQELGEFFGAVQVALISTFVGLLMRMWALWLDRLDTTYMLAAADALDAIEAPKQLVPEGS